jgi:hypothetical protein
MLLIHPRSQVATGLRGTHYVDSRRAVPLDTPRGEKRHELGRSKSRHSRANAVGPSAPVALREQQICFESRAEEHRIGPSRGKSETTRWDKAAPAMPTPRRHSRQPRLATPLERASTKKNGQLSYGSLDFLESRFPTFVSGNRITRLAARQAQRPRVANRGEPGGTEACPEGGNPKMSLDTSKPARNGPRL